MRVLLSTMGSRGDVQPLVALAVRLRELGQEVRLCAPPDFGDWINGLGIPFVPVGPQVRSPAKSGPPVARPLPSAEQQSQMAEGILTAQFEAIPAAAQCCDVIVGFAPLQLATRSVAEQLGIRYVFATFCPTTLPSPHHAPPSPFMGTADNRTLWAEQAERWNGMFGAALNSRRASAGLAPVDDVRSHMFTDQPWLAADPTLAPWPEPADPDVLQTGAWLLADERPLSRELERFLDAGEPPVYFGFGSMPDPGDVSRTMIETARALGRRAIVSRGWADLALPDDEPDCLAIEEANLQALFQRVAAVVHHGGSGTTTIAALAGVPQVIVPQHYDQHYFAQRVNDLGAGIAHSPGAPTTDSLTAALGHALEPGVAANAKLLADSVRADGADVAAQRLMAGL